MSNSAFTIRDDFPAVSYDEWRAGVEADLAGVPFEKKLVTQTYEGIEYQPIYTLRDASPDAERLGMSGEAPITRGSRRSTAEAKSLELRQEYTTTDLSETNRLVHDDLRGGVSALLLKFDQSVRACRDADQYAGDPNNPDGLLAYTVDDLDRTLQGVHADLLGICLDANAAFLPASASLVALWQKRGAPLDEVTGAFGADPLGALARDGEAPYTLDTGCRLLGKLASWTADNAPNVKSVAIDTGPYHDSGATASLDLAYSLATGVTYLRAMLDAGLKLDAAIQQIELRMRLGTHHFLAIAKLRAARRVWGRLIEACGGDATVAPPKICARVGNRVLTRRDQHINMLRNTSAIYAACVGGADAVTSTPYDGASGVSSDLARQAARNTLHVLQDESHLTHVVDPAGGSWFFDTITEQLAESAWELFQGIEKAGGMAAALQSGRVQEQIDASFERRAKDIATRKASIIGVSEFPNIAEKPTPAAAAESTACVSASDRVKEARSACDVPRILADSQELMSTTIDFALRGATIGQLCEALDFHAERTTVERIKPKVFAEPFEQLRDASDAWQADKGERPRVFLVNMGPIAHHTARATFSKNFFEVGGFEVETNDGFGSDIDAAAAAFANSGARVAVICSSDKLYPQVAPETAQRLKAAGARTVYLAGHPGENEMPWREAGVDRFIFMKCDVLATLRELLEEEGVLRK